MVKGTLPVIDSTTALKLKYGKKTLKVEYKLDEKTCAEEFPLLKLSGNTSFQEILRQWEILTIHTMEASLEDIFIQVTGQQLKQ